MTEHPLIRRAYAAAAARDPDQTGFLQALEALYDSLGPCLEDNAAYADRGLLERLGEPERTGAFPVRWTGSGGRTRQARGFFIQYSTALGPGRGGLLFRPGLDMGAAKALALETTLENSLAGLAAGGAFYGADVSPAGWDSRESLSFCRGFLEGLLPLLPCPLRPGDWDGLVPRRELGYLAGQYERLTALSPARQAVPPFPDEPAPMCRWEAAGHGLCVFAELALRQTGLPGLEGQTVLISGRDGPAPWAGEQAIRLGAQVTVLGDRAGCLYAPEGLPLSVLRQMTAQPGLPLLLWAIRTPGVEYRPGPGLWSIPADAVFLCDDRDRLDGTGARQLASHRPAAVFEGVPRACTPTAARTLAGSGSLFGPAIAAGAGGAVMVLGRPDRTASPWEADRYLRTAMAGIFQAAWEESLQAGRPGDLARGARAAAFRRIADAALQKGW